MKVPLRTYEFLEKKVFWSETVIYGIDVMCTHRETSTVLYNFAEKNRKEETIFLKVRMSKKSLHQGWAFSQMKA